MGVVYCRSLIIENKELEIKEALEAKHGYPRTSSVFIIDYSGSLNSACSSRSSAETKYGLLFEVPSWVSDCESFRFRLILRSSGFSVAFNFGCSGSSLNGVVHLLVSALVGLLRGGSFCSSVYSHSKITPRLTNSWPQPLYANFPSSVLRGPEILIVF
jgi:hypothetical protein